LKGDTIMAIIRWNPLRDVTAWNPVSDLTSEIASMQREMDRVFDRFMRGGGSVDDGTTSTIMPPVDIIEHDNEYIVKVDLPGVKKEDVKITITNDVLTLRGEKTEEKEHKGKNYHRMERGIGSFQRSFTLPTSVKSDKIEAEFRDGILTISLPKPEEAKPKQIEVKVK
jgi:HSP20 family protein